MNEEDEIANFDERYFVRLLEIESVTSSVLVGFFFTVVISVVEKMRAEQLNLFLRTPFWETVSLQVGIVIYAYLTLSLFLVFIGMNIVAFERLVSKNLQNARKIHTWSLGVLILASLTGAVTLMLFSAFVIPRSLVNPLLGIFSSLQFVASLVLMLLGALYVIGFIASVVRSTIKTRAVKKPEESQEDQSESRKAKSNVRTKEKKQKFNRETSSNENSAIAPQTKQMSKEG